MPTYEDISFGNNPVCPDDRIRVKTCKDPDRVCLEGGCMYCHQGTFKLVESLRAYAYRKDNENPFEGWVSAFRHGWRYGWPSYPMKREVQ